MIFRFKTMLLIGCFFISNSTGCYGPLGLSCLRKRGDVWWEVYQNGTERCEVLDNEECGVCGRAHFDYIEFGKKSSVCWHYALNWKFDFYKTNTIEQQRCLITDHCKMSFPLRSAQSSLNYICGTESGGYREQRGKCKSVYGTYICDCKKPYQGRDCRDIGPEGAYATGVQVLLDTKVRVSNWMTILVAVKHKGNDFKVHIESLTYSTEITITEHTINDPTSKKLIERCKLKTKLGSQCTKYLEGSTYIYSVDIRFPLVRNNHSVFYYIDSQVKNKPDYPVGYYTKLVITTTNTVKGIKTYSFYRTNYDRVYQVFVQYPIDTGCYKNIKIINCEELRDRTNIYHASSGIVLYGQIFDVQFHEEKSLPCRNTGDKTMKWTIKRVKSDGTLSNFYKLEAREAFEFVIQPYSFKNGMYVVEFSYTMSNDLAKSENFDQCFFTVVENPYLIAIIEGGRSRYVNVDTRITLDGHKSNDPNLKGNNSKDGLNFEWSCIVKQTNQACLENYLSSKLGSHYYIKLPPSILEAQKEYIIELRVTKFGKMSAYSSQTLFAGSWVNFQSIGLVCVNCMEGNIANPTDYIYLLVKVVLKPNASIKHPLNYTWTFSTHPVYPPDTSVESIRVNVTSQDLLKIEKNQLKQNNSYCFRAEIQDNKVVFSEIDIHIPPINDFTCSLTPDSGIVAVTNFSLNCSTSSGLKIEVYDKSSSDTNYFSGRMLFTDLYVNRSFKLANERIVVYGYNEYKMIQEWVYEVKLTPFHSNLKDIDDMVKKITMTSKQTRLHSASVIPCALHPEVEWYSMSLLKRLISLIYQVEFKDMRYTKLVLSSIEFILVTTSKNDSNKKFKLQIEEAKMCADIIYALAGDLSARVKEFESEVTLTETILHQMIRSHLNVVEMVLSVKNADVLSKPLYLVNPYTLQIVKDTTYELVDTLYKLSTCLLWRQVQGDYATEIVSSVSKIVEWTIVRPPKVLYHLRRQNTSIPFNFSFGFYQIIKDLDALGIQVTTINDNPFWWASNDINTEILLVDICFKINPTECKFQRVFYKYPIFLYFNISQIYTSIEPLQIHTVYLNLSKDPHDLDLDITVYRFEPPLRAKLFIQFEFENLAEDYRVLFSENKRPDFEMMQEKGITINNGNQSTEHYVHYTRVDSDKLFYMGIFPVQKGDARKRVKFKLKIVYAVCKTWLRWKWGNERCWVGEQETDERTLRCDCNHLSIFAGEVQVPSYTLNPAMEFMLFLTEEFNWLPLVVLIVIILVFIFLYAWGWRKDRKDSTKGIVTVLEDNYPGERFAYLVGVYTGSRINSSTDANVGMKLFGENDRSRAHILKHRNRPALRGNTDDWFLLYSPTHLGTLESLQIWHDNSGNSPDWFIEKVEVYDLTDKFEYIFELNVWLSMGADEYPDAVVAPSSINDFYSFRRVFLANVINGFRDTHYWTSIFWKHARNPVKRVHRISTVLCYIMVAMICSVIVYYFNKGTEYKEDEPSYELNYTDFVVFIIAILVATFTTCLIMFLFRKSYSHKYTRMQSSLFVRPEDTSKKNKEFLSLQNNNPTYQIDKDLGKLSTVSLYDSTRPRFIELSSKNLDEKSISLGLRGKLPSERNMYENLAAAIHAVVRGSTLEPVRLPKYKSSAILHKKYFILAWILFIVVFLVAAVIVILFGHQISNVEGEKWLTIFLCVLLFDALILSTLKILLCSLILGCVFQRLVPASNYKMKPEEGMQKNLIGDTDHLIKLAQIRSHPMYCPLNEKSKELHRVKFDRREHWKTLFDFCVVLLLILVLVMLTSLFTVSLYSSNAHAAWMLTKGPSLNYKNLTNTYNRTLFQDFLLNNFIYQLHRYLWYNQEDSLTDIKRRKSWTYDCTMRLLGNGRIRQLRVILGECPDFKYFENMGEYCSPPWSYAVEDTGTYGARWYIGGFEDRRKSTAWRYTDAASTNSSETYGTTLTIYPSGGYMENLGFEKDDTEGALANLFPQHWLDHMTRAVFVELTLYNVNTRLFTQVILIAEQMPTGEYLVDVHAESVNKDFTFDIWKFSFSVFLIYLLVRMCVLMNRKGVFVYFSKIEHVFEGFLLALGFLTLCFYLIHITSSSDYVQEFQRSGIDAFFNFSILISYIIWSRTALCFLFVFAVIRMLISFRFGRIYYTFYYAFLLSTPWIVWLALYFMLYLAVFQRFVCYLLAIYSNYSSVIVYNKDSTTSEDFSRNFAVYLMNMLSFVVILLFIASFAYYYKVAKSHKLIDNDNFSFYTFLKVILINKVSNK